MYALRTAHAHSIERRKSGMKTRDQIYHREGEKLLRFLTTYHALKYEQVMKMFGNQDSIKLHQVADHQPGQAGKDLS